jgi:hypothetical protein
VKSLLLAMELPLLIMVAGVGAILGICALAWYLFRDSGSHAAPRSPVPLAEWYPRTPREPSGPALGLAEILMSAPVNTLHDGHPVSADPREPWPAAMRRLAGDTAPLDQLDYLIPYGSLTEYCRD